MGHPLFNFADRLEKRRKTRRSERDLVNVVSDPHIARDVGLPYRPAPKIRIDQW